MKVKRCKVLCPPGHHYSIVHRCTRKATCGDYCTQHATHSTPPRTKLDTNRLLSKLDFQVVDDYLRGARDVVEPPIHNVQMTEARSAWKRIRHLFKEKS